MERGSAIGERQLTMHTKLLSPYFGMWLLHDVTDAVVDSLVSSEKVAPELHALRQRLDVLVQKGGLGVISD